MEASITQHPGPITAVLTFKMKYRLTRYRISAELFSEPQRILMQQILKSRMFRNFVTNFTQIGQKEFGKYGSIDNCAAMYAFHSTDFHETHNSSPLRARVCVCVCPSEFNLNRSLSSENRESSIYACK